MPPAFSLTGADRLAIGLAAIDHNTIRSAMSRKSLAEEPLGRCQIAMFAEEELNGIADAVDSAIEIHPPPPYLDCVFRGRRPLIPTHGDHLFQSMTTSVARVRKSTVGCVC